MKIITRTAAAAMLISLPMTLGACGGGDSKPSKADVEAGFVKAMKSSSGGGSASDAALKKVASCTIDKVYDKVSAKTLNAVKSGDTSKKISSDDESTLSDASKGCASAATAG